MGQLPNGHAERSMEATPAEAVPVNSFATVRALEATFFLSITCEELDKRRARI